MTGSNSQYDFLALLKNVYSVTVMLRVVKGPINTGPNQKV